MLDTTLAQQRPAQASDWIGRTLEGRYRLQSILGEGGMGTVFVAEHQQLGRQVAIKMLRPELTAIEEVAARFDREALASAKLDHPNIVSAVDVGTLDDGSRFIVMPLIKGRNLQQLIEEQGALPPTLVREVGIQVASALAAAHEARIVHRDLKPENILLGAEEDGSLKAYVTDFGVAHIMSGDSSIEVRRGLTQAGAILGTPGYMSPEQATGEPLNAQTDLYSLGIILWECLTGAALYSGETLSAVFAKLLTGTPPPVRSQQPHVPVAMESLVQALLERDPEARPPSSRDVKKRLVQLRQAMEPAVAINRGLREKLPSLTHAIPDAFFKWTMYAATLVWLTLVTSLVVAARLPRDGGSRSGGIEVRAEAAAPLAQEEEVPPPPKPSPKVSEHYHKLQSETERSTRRKSAEWLLEHRSEPGVSEAALLMAELETAKGCRAKREVVEKIREAVTRDAVPALEYWSARPKKGCGFLNLRDCWRCLRAPLRKTLSELRSEKEPDAAGKADPSQAKG